MFDIFDTYATDESLEVGGAWFPIGPVKDGKQARLLVARSNNKRYNKALANEVDKHQTALGLEDDAAEALQTEITINVMASTLLLGWENVGFKGEEKPYSVSTARDLLGVKDFRIVVSRFANQMEAFKVKKEKDQKNDSASI